MLDLYRTPIERIQHRTTKPLERERFLFGGKPEGVEFFAGLGMSINLPPDREWFAFSPLAPRTSTALQTSPDLRRMYSTFFGVDMRPDKRNENVTIRPPRRRPLLRLHTAQTLLDSNPVMHTYPNEINILWGALAALNPKDLLPYVARRGIVVVDQNKVGTESVIGIPLPMIPQRLRPAGLTGLAGIWKEILRFRPRTLVALNPDMLYNEGHRTALNDILRNFVPVGIRTN